MNYWGSRKRAVCRYLDFSFCATSSSPVLCILNSSYLYLFVHSVTKLCPALCNPMEYSMPGLPVPHPLLKFAQVHVQNCIGDAIQPSHPLMLSFISALNLPQHQGLFQWVGYSHQMTKILELQLQHQTIQWVFRVDFLKIDCFDLLAIQGTLRSLLQHHIQRYQFFGTLLSLRSRSHNHMWPLGRP